MDDISRPQSNDPIPPAPPARPPTPSPASPVPGGSTPVPITTTPPPAPPAPASGPVSSWNGAPEPQPPRKRRLWLWMLLTLILAAALGGAGWYFFGQAKPAPAPEPSLGLQTAGTLTVGTALGELPWGAYNKETGKPEGGEVELAALISEKMGLKLQFVNKGFDDLIPELVAQKFDVIVAGMSITDERKGEIDFTDPYYTAGQVITVKATNTTIRSKDDLGGKIVGTLAGTTSETYAKSLTGPAAPKEVRSYDEAGKYYVELSAGKIDAVIYDSVAGSWYSKQNPDFKVVGGRLTSEGYGIGVRKGDTELMRSLNAAIIEAKADPKYQTIVKKWYE